MNAPLTGISSMATRAVLGELVDAWNARGATPAASIESVGGVDAARRVESGEAFDLVILAADAIARLAAAGHVRADGVAPIVRSDVAVAVPAGAPRPDISSEAALREAVLAAPSLGYSTGPSGTALLRLFERWGVLGDVQARLVQAPPGVPVGALVACGDVALGFQQRPELMSLAGIDLLGDLPASVGIVTTFSGAVATRSAQPEAARALLDYLASPATGDLKRRHGMAPA